MKIFKLIPLFLFFSCIDFITQNSIYNSLHFVGGSWIEIKSIESMKMDPSSNDFSLQFWISGSEVDTNEAPALFSLTDKSGNNILSLLRDPNLNSRLIAMINSEIYSEDIINLDFSDSNNFHLISFIFSNNSNVKVYIDSTALSIDLDNIISFNDEMLIIGAMANKERTILENFWYGYIDEIRLWNTILADSVIKFQSKYPSKLGDHYRYTDEDGNEVSSYLDSLIGIWRLNFEEPTIVINDESGYGHEGQLYTLSGFSVHLSKKGAK